jgi:hypothetical protein
MGWVGKETGVRAARDVDAWRRTVSDPEYGLVFVTGP